MRLGWMVKVGGMSMSTSGFRGKNGTYYAVILCVLLQMSSAAFAASITSSQNGSWNDGPTWSGGIVPGTNDQVQIDHDVVIQTSADVGLSPGALQDIGGGYPERDPAILISENASLTLNTNATLTCRGDLQCRELLSMEEGSTINFSTEYSSATNAFYWLMLADFDNSYEPLSSDVLLEMRGTDTNRCTITSTPTNRAAIAPTIRHHNTGDAKVLEAKPYNAIGRVDAEFAHFLGLGSEVFFALQYIPSSFDTSIRVIDGLFEQCGRVSSSLTSENDPSLGAIDFERTCWMNSIRPIDAVLDDDEGGLKPWGIFETGAAAGSTCSVIECDVDLPVLLNRPNGYTIEDCVFRSGVKLRQDVEGRTGAFIAIRRNLMRWFSEDYDNPIYLSYGDNLEDNLFIHSDTNNNPHYLQLQTGTGTSRVARCLFWFEGPFSGGFFPEGDGPTAHNADSGTPADNALIIENCIFMPNSNGPDSPSNLSANVTSGVMPTSNSRVIVRRNTSFSSGAGGVCIGETGPTVAGALTYVKSNIFVGSTNADGKKIIILDPLYSCTNAILAENADYNAGWRLIDGANYIPGQTGKGYGDPTKIALSFSGSSIIGANDLDDIDPQFVDPFRNPLTWSTSLGGNGSLTNAMDLLKPTGTHSVEELLYYIREGFRPQNESLRSAGDPNDPYCEDQPDMGAVDLASLIPVLVSPEGVTEDLSPTLVWNGVEEVTNYYVEVQNSSNTVVFTQWHDPTNTTPHPEGMEPPFGRFEFAYSNTLTPGYHTWSVQSWNEGTSETSSVMSFHTGPLLPPTTLISPQGGGSNNTPTYTWNVVSNATDYQLWVQNSDAGDPFEFMQWYASNEVWIGGGTCAITPTNVLEERSYRWYIQAMSGDQGGEWSDGIDFAIGTPPASKATLVSPFGETNDLLTYVWEPVHDASKYYLRIRDNDTQTEVFAQWYETNELNFSSGQYSVPLTNAYIQGNHTWWIMAANFAGFAPESDGMDFNAILTLNDPGFEIHTNGAFDFWNSTGSSATFSVSSNVHSGNTCGKIEILSTNDYGYFYGNERTIKAGRYRMTFYLKAENVLAEDRNVHMFFYDGWYWPDPNLSGTYDWSKVSYVKELTEETEKIYIGSFASGTIWIDDISVELVDTNTPIEDLFLEKLLLLHLPMDEASWSGGTDEVIDLSGYDNHGTASGGATTTNGLMDQAGSFDGTDDDVSVSTNASLHAMTNSLTWSLWFKGGVQSDQARLIDFNGDNTLAFDSTGTNLSFWLNSLDSGSGTRSPEVTTTNANLGDDQWHHVVAQWNHSTLHLYLDGTLHDSVSWSNALAVGGELRFGKDLGNANEYSGLIDEVKIYSTALSGSAITTLGDPDNDDMPNWWEAQNSISDPNADDDGDGLINLQEYNLGADPHLTDTDGDGMNDWNEWIAGTALNDSEKFFQIEDLTFISTNPVLSWLSVTGREYTVLYHTNLLEIMGSEDWVISSFSNVSGNGSMFTYTNDAPEAQQFYRIKVEIP